MRRWLAVTATLLLFLAIDITQAAGSPAERGGGPGRLAAVRRVASRVGRARPGARPGGRSLRNTLRAARELGAREVFRFLRQEMQLYRGRKLERLADRIAYGKSDFDPRRTVAENLSDLAAQSGLPTFVRKVGGRDVLHIVVDLGQGRTSRRAIRRIFRRVAQSTIELNYKPPGGSNRAGHVAVRVGGGATYDMTPGVPLPEPVLRSARRLAGRDSIFMARKRSLRRFMEGRKDIGTPSVYYGMLFQASPAETSALEKTFEQRLHEVKSFAFAGGDTSKGEYSCAQFLTHDNRFFAERGVGATAGASSAASAAARSPKLDAVIVYKTARTSIEDLPSL